MADPTTELQELLVQSTKTGFRSNLLDKGLARGLIWSDGELPEGAPNFPPSLTEDLLDYAYAVMSMSLRLRVLEENSELLRKAFRSAGEAIEAAVHRGKSTDERGFHRVNAAVAFHLARYAAQAYSILPSDSTKENLAPTEVALVHLIRRKLNEMRDSCSQWLLAPEHEDQQIAESLREDEGLDQDDAVHLVLTTSFMRGLALFDHALTTGSASSAKEAKDRLHLTTKGAQELCAVNHWWAATLAYHLIDELWQLSMHQQIPLLPDTDSSQELWADLRRKYIHRLRMNKTAEIELWPSQLEAVQRAIDPADNLVVGLPTSAGKTRIAEFCILRSLASGRRVLYVTPLRALSAQVERDLAKIFIPLGFSVSSLYGTAGIGKAGNDTLRNRDIVVSTPEKLDFALRNDEAVIADVGLIVFDEGHMLGVGEREIRYEALMQRILRREDANTRRIVCLSALFPPAEKMKNFVAWLRKDKAGEAVHSTWRPTRKRFGTICWSVDAALLFIKAESENSFVREFIKAIKPPQGSKRRKEFPNNQQELTLASAWRFVEDDKDVLIFCPLRKSIEPLGKKLLKCIKHKVLKPRHNGITDDVRSAMNVGAEWLGEKHPAVQCLQYGVALHHGGLPRPFLKEVERLLRKKLCPLIIASPTLAQGLNLSASVLLVHSIWRNRNIIPPSEFANIVGRAGRAYVDVEGLVLYIDWENTFDTQNNWRKLIEKSKISLINNGILQLSVDIYMRIAKVAGIEVEEVIDYITGHDEAWNLTEEAEKKWERNIASLDSAILALIDAEAKEGELCSTFDDALKGSLFSRQLAELEEKIRKLLRDFIIARTQRIWAQTKVNQRKGYHAAGVGLSAGQFLDSHIEELVRALTQAEAAILEGDADATATAIVGFAGQVFTIAPFAPYKNLPKHWDDALRLWISGKPTVKVLGILEKNGVEFLQDAIIYRLPWAMEAVRVHGSAVECEGANGLEGLAALAVESGSINRSVIQLLRSGLSSRKAALAAVDSTAATFDDRHGMRVWLDSEEIREKSTDSEWPTPESYQVWQSFLKLEDDKRQDKRPWKDAEQSVSVIWQGESPDAEKPLVIVVSNTDQERHLVLTPDFFLKGVLEESLNRPLYQVVGVVVGKKANTVDIKYFGLPGKIKEQNTVS